VLAQAIRNAATKDRILVIRNYWSPGIGTHRNVQFSGPSKEVSEPV
jgi:hypothetical protein